jgi:hypothetical protein
MRLRHLIDELNIGIYNPVGLNILWPQNVGFLYVSVDLFWCGRRADLCGQLEIEYYVSAEPSQLPVLTICMNSECCLLVGVYICTCAVKTERRMPSCKDLPRDYAEWSHDV